MQRSARVSLMPLFFITILLFGRETGLAQPADQPDPGARCPVCGMFVAKYDNWIAQAKLADGTVLFFDGVKDMMAFHHHPDQYGQAGKKDIMEIWVKDYYSLQWLDGRQAFYVTGSDVYGPMGHEFIPFSTRDAAAAFAGDHHGENIIPFTGISDDLVESMRAGMKMRHDRK